MHSRIQDRVKFKGQRFGQTECKYDQATEIKFLRSVIGHTFKSGNTNAYNKK